MNRTPRAVLISGLALIVAVGLANAWLLSSREDDLRAELAAAVGSSLPFDGRLSGGFLPSELTSKRSGEASAVRLSPDARIALAQLEKRTAANPTPQALANLGIALLIQGDIDRSIATLRDAAAEQPQASTWNDLSVAYLAKADRAPTRRVEYLSHALEAAAQSLRMAPSNNALFNRALALDGLAPLSGKSAPWDDFVRREHDPRWVSAATRHRSSRPTGATANVVWDTRRRALQERLERPDESLVLETAKSFPEASIEVLEQLLLDWANAEVAGDQHVTQSIARKASHLATAIDVATNDRMWRDVVTVLPSGKHALARAHLAYFEGVRLYQGGNYQRATQTFELAREGFAAVKSPYRHWAEARLATILFQQRQLDGADRLLRSIAASAESNRYETLLGRTLWLRGLVSAKAWRLTDALDAFHAAAACFQRSGEHEFAVSIYSAIADTLRSLGEQQDSWQYIGRTLEGASRLRHPLNRYLLFYNASLFALRADLFEAALLFQNAAVEEASAAGKKLVVESLAARAQVHLRRHDRAAAETDLEAATNQLPEVPEGAVRNYLTAEIDELAADLGRTSGQTSLESAVAFFTKTEPARVPRLYLALARTHLGNRSFSQAEAALATGIEQLERQHASLGDEALKISYFDESWALFREMVGLQLTSRGDPARAFDYAERSRARTLLSIAADGKGVELISLGDLQKAMPPTTALVYYVTLDDRLAIWTITSRGVDRTEVRISAADLERLVALYRAALAEQRPASSLNARLYSLLIQPVADRLAATGTIVFAPDGELQQMPFATLRNPASNRYLVEDHAVMITPSASLFAAVRARWRGMTNAPIASALLIGNPATTGAALPEAEAEVMEAARFYPGAKVLTGPAATKATFLETAPLFEVVHFGGHGYVNVEYPLLSRLAFSAPDGGQQDSLFAHEIAKLHFERTRVVILAACSTAGGTVSRGEGVVSVTRPFLGAGVPVVIASYWDVDDRATRRLFLEFHRALSASRDPVSALRMAQLAMLADKDQSFASPANWGAFAALGTIVH